MRSQTLLRGILTFLVVYFSAFGMTFNGILIPELRWMTLFILVIGLCAWFIAHHRAKWVWQRTPLDIALILWMVVIGVSILANVETWRRSATALWFVVGYILLWYMLADWLMNERLHRETLIDAIIMGGLVIVFFGYLQFVMALGRGDFARVGSLVGNPNSLGAYVLMLLTLIIGRIFTLKNIFGRRLLMVYALITGILLGITFSRGAWIGGAVSLVMLIGLNLPDGFWRRIRPTTRRMWLIWGVSALVSSLIVIVVIVIIVRSFSLSGRSLDLRTDIYTNAITIFAESPIIGHGLFTFGREFAQQQSQPPRQPHSHAHNGVLLVMAELGLVGLSVLVLSVITVLVMMRRNWRGANAQQRRLLSIGMAGAIGFGVHHLLDFPAMMPLIAVTGLIPLAIAIIPYQPQPLRTAFRMIGHPSAMLIATIGFISVGGWMSYAYSSYTALVARPFAPNADMTYAQVGDALQAVIDTDPAMAWYYHQQGYLYALSGDDAQAIHAYQAFLAFEPTYSIAWANIASLYWRMGDATQAIDAQQRAISLAPDFAPYQFGLGIYLEASGDVEAARGIYRQLIQAGNSLWSAWEVTPFRQSVLSEFDISDSHRLVIALDTHQSTDLLTLWRGSQYRAENSTRASILWLMVALRTGEAVDVSAQMAQAKRLSQTIYDEAWIALGESEIARHAGDLARADAYLAQARDKIAFKFNREDIIFITNIPYFQFLVTSIPRQLLPDVFYPTPDAALGRLLED